MSPDRSPSGRGATLPRELAHLARMWAPVITEASSADQSLGAPLVAGPIGTPLPSFAPPPPSSRSARARSVVVDDADATKELPTRKLAAVDPLDDAETLKRAPMSRKQAAFVTRDGSLPSFSPDGTEELELDLEEEEPEPIDLRARSRSGIVAVAPKAAPPPERPRVPTLSPVSREVDGTAQVDFFDTLDLEVDSTMELVALRRRKTIRNKAGLVILGVIVGCTTLLGIAAIHVGQTQSRDLAMPIETLPPEVVGASTPAPTATTVTTAIAVREAKPIETSKPIEPANATATPVAIAPTTTVTVKPAKLDRVVTTAPKAPPVAPKSKPIATPSKFGVVLTPAAAKGHRVWVDGFLSGYAPQPIKVHCGAHTVRVGSAGSSQKVQVPCGGEVHVSMK